MSKENRNLHAAKKNKKDEFYTQREDIEREAFEKQKGICPKCEQQFELSQMEADHSTPGHKGGKTIPENCQMLYRYDNRRKSG